MSYSGETSFEFVIERYKDRDSGKLYCPDTVPSDDEFEFEPLSISLFVEGRAYYDSGNRYGSIDDCYDEDGGSEIMSCANSEGQDMEDQLTKKERELILQMIVDEVAG